MVRQHVQQHTLGRCKLGVGRQLRIRGLERVRAAGVALPDGRSKRRQELGIRGATET